jgi:hypothetical protein
MALQLFDFWQSSSLTATQAPSVAVHRPEFRQAVAFWQSELKATTQKPSFSVHMPSVRHSLMLPHPPGVTASEAHPDVSSKNMASI